MSISINRLEYHVQRALPAVYDESLSYYELLAKVIAKLNEVTDEVNSYFSEDIEVHVGAILSGWYDDGTLANIINNDVFTQMQNDIDTRATKTELNTLSNNVDLKADKYYTDANLSRIQGLADFAREQLADISWYNRQYWLDDNNDIQAGALGTNYNSWYVLETLNKLIFTVTPETKWIIVGMGQDFSTRCFAVNIMGLTNRSLREIPQTGSAIIVDDTITGEQANVGDVINIKINAKTVMFYKNGVSWFNIITSNYAQIEHVRLGVAHTYVSNAYMSLSNFMNLDDYNQGTLITPPSGGGALSKWKGKDWVLIGDSITANDGKTYTSWAGHEDELTIGYQTLVNEKVNTFDQMVTKAYGGTPMTNNGNTNAGVSVVKATSFAPYDLVTIFHGTNDFKLNQPIGTIGSISDSTFNEASFYGAYRASIEHILTSDPTIQIVLITPLQRDNDGYDTTYVNSAGHKLEDYVNAVIAVGNLYGLPVLDLYHNGAFNKLTLSTYTYDGLHPNNEGYEVIADKLYTFLEKNV